MNVVIQRITLLMLALTFTLALSACAGDPAEDKEEATVSEAVEIPEPDATEEGAESGTEGSETSEASAPEVEGTKYEIDSSISTISFTGSKVTGTHSGGWSDYTCDVVIPDGDFTQAKINLEIDMTSTFSDDKDLTDTLKSEKMFDVETYPTANFVSTSIEGEDGEYKVSGNLTLHGVTKNVTFTTDVELDEETLIAEAEFSINRKDFDINYDGLAGDLIREKVLMLFYVEGSPAE